jgi:hypothetical protein
MGQVLDALCVRISALRNSRHMDKLMSRNMKLQKSISRLDIIGHMKECKIPEWRISSTATTICKKGLTVSTILV